MYFSARLVANVMFLSICYSVMMMSRSFLINLSIVYIAYVSLASSSCSTRFFLSDNIKKQQNKKYFARHVSQED